MAGRKALVLGFVVAALSSGCGTVHNIRQPVEPPVNNPAAPVCRVYGGLRGDWAVMSTYPWNRVSSVLDYLVAPMMGVDLVFTAAGDTVTLPYTIGVEIWRVVRRPSRPDPGAGSEPPPPPNNSEPEGQ